MHDPGVVTVVALDLADDGRDRVARERDVAPRVVALHGLDERHAGDLVDVLEGLRRPCVARGELTGERQEARHERIAIHRRASAIAVTLEEATVALGKRKEKRDRKFEIFRSLMLTREAWLSPEHVRALNGIELEFHGDSRAEGVLAAWRKYLGHLGLPLYKTAEEQQKWSVDRVEFFVELLAQLAAYFLFKFDREFILKNCYAPRYFAELEDQQTQMRRLMLELLNGQRALPVGLLGLPMAAPAPDAIATADLKKQLDEPAPAKLADPSKSS